MTDKEIKQLVEKIYKDKVKKDLSLDNNSNVLLIGCEGDTDEDMYNKLINS